LEKCFLLVDSSAFLNDGGMDRLRAFEVFAAVVANGSFARAAGTLDTSPANVTRYIKELEEALGTRLLNRSSRRLSLTESGRAFYERVRAILEDVAEAEATVSFDAAQPRGRLRINAPLSFGVLYLVPLWAQFMALYPDIELDINLIDRVVELVEEGFDLAVRISPAGSTDHVSRKLVTARNVVCASPDYIVRHGTAETLSDLTNHACIGYAFAANGDEWSFLGKGGTSLVVTAPCVLHCKSGHAMRAAALAGKGIVQLPTFMVGRDLREGTLLPLLKGYRVPDIDVLAIYPSRRHLSAKVRVMIDFLVEAFRGTSPWDLPQDHGHGAGPF
jgi:DNA-binding transcriptional LysR family regulator